MLTCRGGLTSHAAVVMRGMGKSAVTGARDLCIDVEGRRMWTRDGRVEVKAGDEITIDGSTGKVYRGLMPLVSAGENDDFRTLLQWADKYKNMHVLANADTPEDAWKALELGAEGIGLCRTEHMFFKPERLNLFRHMILCDKEAERDRSLESLLPMQRDDFVEIFRIMNGLQVTIRLIDPPIHEFLPSPQSKDFKDEVFRLSGQIGLSTEYCERRILELQEKNPMLGCRGCRLSIIYPDILDMQVRAIIGAALSVRKEDIRNKVQIMIPLVFSDHEVDEITPSIMRIAHELCYFENTTIHDLGLELGAMIEVPRACIRADKIAATTYMNFISFGSNDLTQLTFGMSRDDTQQFLVSLLLELLHETLPNSSLLIRSQHIFPSILLLMTHSRL